MKTDSLAITGNTLTCELAKTDADMLQSKLHRGKAGSWEVSVKRWYKKRTLDENAMFHGIVNEIAHEIAIDPAIVKEGIKENPRGPKIVWKGKQIPKPTHLCNTAEMAEYIDIAIQEAAEAGVDVWTEYTEYETWKGEKGLYRDMSLDEYRDRHKFCEACGFYLILEGEIAHIKSRGAGGEDTPRNVLMLCQDCHRGVQHDQGWERFLNDYPHLRYKIKAALEE